MIIEPFIFTATDFVQLGYVIKHVKYDNELHSIMVNIIRVK